MGGSLVCSTLADMVSARKNLNNESSIDSSLIQAYNRSTDQTMRSSNVNRLNHNSSTGTNLRKTREYAVKVIKTHMNERRRQL